MYDRRRGRELENYFYDLARMPSLRLVLYGEGCDGVPENNLGIVHLSLDAM